MADRDDNADRAPWPQDGGTDRTAPESGGAGWTASQGGAAQWGSWPQDGGVDWTSWSQSTATAGDPTTADRVVSWQVELRTVHHRIVLALAQAQMAVATGRATRSLSRDLRLHCHGFCAALDGHHRAEDDALFPRLIEQAPQLAPVVERLKRDHVAIAGVLAELESSLGDSAADPNDLMARLDGIKALMKSHFADEERSLNAVLRGLRAPAEEAGHFFGAIATDPPPPVPT